MQLEELISGARDVVSVKRVYGDPYEKNGLTVIPAATVRGGGGGGMGESEGGESGGGGGFGLMARPSGAWIVEDGVVTWKPAIDVNRIVLGGQIVALAAILVSGRILLAQARRRRSLLELVPRLPKRRNMQLHLPKLARR
jgi:uncharacterized spore protein YtfJ